jgi:hypothetical protein
MSLIIVTMKVWTVTVIFPTTSSRIQLRSSTIVVTSDSETEEEESSEPENSDDKTSDV